MKNKKMSLAMKASWARRKAEKANYKEIEEREAEIEKNMKSPIAHLASALGFTQVTGLRVNMVDRSITVEY